ncbi:hypothetical protein LCGC14_0926080 [marine sediment metagenome]|uniref:Lmo0937 family membrane protein n=2 Tax=root TaxID=1 RepID=A0A831QKS3_9FLAO|nr:lmo0937 family membrane protein [Pricia sp.]HEA20008.1 lmo0937 family membrane protein [Pricia antarctica]
MKYIVWPLVIILVVGWVVAVFVFKVLSGIIHLLLLAAVGLIIYNFITGKRNS